MFLIYSMFYLLQDGYRYTGVSINWGFCLWASLYLEPYYLGSILRALVFGNSHIKVYRAPLNRELGFLLQEVGVPIGVDIRELPSKARCSCGVRNYP